MQQASGLLTSRSPTSLLFFVVVFSAWGAHLAAQTPTLGVNLDSSLSPYITANLTTTRSFLTRNGTFLPISAACSRTSHHPLSGLFQDSLTGVCVTRPRPFSSSSGHSTQSNLFNTVKHIRPLPLMLGSFPSRVGSGPCLSLQPYLLPFSPMGLPHWPPF